MTLLFVLATVIFSGAQTRQEETVTFTIRGFEISGNTIYDEAALYPLLKGFTGKDKSAEDVEKARDALEQIYHKQGYPAVLVNIPEQTVDDGIVRLQVIESRIGKVKVTGNRYVGRSKLLRKLPSLKSGDNLYIPDLQENLAVVNRSADVKVAPVLVPGQEPGLIDVELKVADRLPLHGSLEMSNRSTHDTTELRLNAMLRYDNLWQKEHSVSLQYQTSPRDTEEVQVIAGSYVLPTPWNDNHLLALYAVGSDSQTATGEGFKVIGKGNIYGARLVMPLPEKNLYAHNLTAGADLKDFDETLGFLSEAEGGIKTPVRYFPLLFSYNGTLPDASGRTQFSAALNMAFRGLTTDQREFEIKRYQARGNYLYATLGMERTQKLPLGMGLFAKLDGQIADQPLISNEQYTAGGGDSVRGYKESEMAGDDAVHGTIEVFAPDLAGLVGLGAKLQVVPFIFYDGATLRTQSPLPGQDQWDTIQGAGAGVQGTVAKFIEYEVALAWAMEPTNRVQRGDHEIHFRVKGSF